MKFGMNLLLWSDQLDESLLSVLHSLCSMGYDGVEIPLFNLDLDYASWGRQLDQIGLERTAVTVRGEQDNPISPDPKIRAAGIEQTKRALDCCAAVGATHLVGPLHSALGLFTGRGPTSEEWNWGIESVRAMAEYAGQLKITLGLECLNRFECYLLNTQADTARFVGEIDHPQCQMLYDTFHSHIEEKEIAEAAGECAGKLCEVHISENDRSTPGKGIVRWQENFDALREIDYNGWMVIEAFGTAMPGLAAATKVWRRMYESELQLASDGLAFMRQEVAKRWN